MSNSKSNISSIPLMGRPVQGKDRKWYNQFGEIINFDPKDIKYSELFWSKQPVGIREAMIENVLSAAETGLIGVFVSSNDITEYDKERLSAYRTLAKQMGYEVGQYRFNLASGNVTAPICKV